MAESDPIPDGSDNQQPAEIVLREKETTNEASDLKIFWGPEICRLEYLVHLLDTGRIKQEPLPHRV